MPETGVREGGVDGFGDGRFGESPKMPWKCSLSKSEGGQRPKGKEHRGIGSDGWG